MNHRRSRGAAPFAGILLLASIGGCTSARMIESSDPNVFGRNLFEIARNGNERDWGSQLTKARRDMGSEYVIKHFQAWSKTLNDLSKSFETPPDQLEFRLNDNGLEFNADGSWHLLLRVANENGALKINQD
jgi:hypothetical protein